MSRFIKLTISDGSCKWININHIVAVESLSSGCYIHFSNSASSDKRIYPEYTESPEMVMELINKAIGVRKCKLNGYDGICT